MTPEQLNGAMHGIASLPRVTTPVRKLDPSAWPQCPICGDSLATHDCDPDATFAAMLGALNMGGSNG
jgi:hypothetical protein